MPIHEGGVAHKPIVDGEHPMRASTLRTYTVPSLPNPPTRVANGTDVPVRIVVRNKAGVPIFLANEIEVLTGPDAPGSMSWTLAPGDEEIFVLAQRQSLFANAAGTGALLQIAISEALPSSIRV